MSLDCSTSLRVCLCCFNIVFLTSYVTVEMIKQFPENDTCCSLSFHGDVVYIGSRRCVIQWNVVTDAVVRLKGYPGLNCLYLNIPGFTCHIVFVFALDVSPDGSVVVGASAKNVIAHNTATGAVLWRKKMFDKVCTLRVHGGVVVVPVDNSNIVVLDVTTGHQLHTLSSGGVRVYGICVFDGLKSDVSSFVDFLTPWYSLSTANEGSLEGG